MKTIIYTLIFAILSMVFSFAFAADADHPDRSCYTASAEVPEKVPATICLTHVMLNAETKKLALSGDKFSDFEFPIFELVRINEDVYSFSAVHYITYEGPESCDLDFCENKIAQLIIAGQADQAGFVSNNELNITVGMDYYEGGNLIMKKIYYQLSK
jgi:hypothetical protein